MIKIIEPGSYQFGEAVAYLIKRGHALALGGNDRSSFMKRASAKGYDLFKNIHIHDDEVPIHLIGIGATESFGPNRNGDGFKRASCRKYHDTFVKSARFYRSHLNTNPAKSYGRIAGSYFNDEMDRIELLAALNATKSAAERNGGLIADEELEKIEKNEDIPVSMACARPGTLVKTDHGFKPIEEIEENDMVLTKYGRYRRVEATLKRFKRQVTKVKTQYYGRQVLEFTPDHRFWVARWKDIPAPPNRNTLKSRDKTGFSRRFRKKYRDQLHAHARYVPCGDLQTGDLLLMPIDRGDGSSDVTVSEARMLGYYTAEGSRAGDGYLCLTTNTQDVLLKEMPALVGDTSWEAYEHSASEKAVNILVYDKPLSYEIYSQVGTGVRNKVIPRLIIDAPVMMKLEFMAAWLNGDGWQDVKGLHWSTCSRTLSIELQNLLASVGIPASVYRIDHTSDLPDRPRTGDGIEYTVNVSNRYSASFAGRSKVTAVEMKAEKTTVFITGDYLAVPVDSVRTEEGEFEVYDISVEEDSSFTAYGLAVSNCKVAYDICSGCGNRAPTRKQYCTEATCPYGGLTKNITKVADDGHVLHADNPHPHFIDMSKVRRNADRTAFSLGILKTASTIKSGAELAEDYGLFDDWSITGYSDARVAGMVRHIHKLAHLERELEENPQAFVRERGRAFDPSLYEAREWTNHFKSASEKMQVLKAFTDRRSLLPLADFISLTHGDTVKSADMAARVSRRLPGIYGRLTISDDLEQSISSHNYSFDEVAYNSKAASVGEKLAHQWSLDEGPFERRIMLSSLRSLSRPALKSAAVEKETVAEKLAVEYALYKAACVSHWSKVIEDPRYSELAVIQNYL